MSESQVQNTILHELLSTLDIYSHRTLLYTIDVQPVAYVSEYKMHSESGDFNWYTTWKHEMCNDRHLLENASIFIHDARARLYFPAFLDTRIPPRNREGLAEILQHFGMTVYDKFELIKRSRGISPIKAGYVEEIEPCNCWLSEIHAIEEIWERYSMSLAESLNENRPAAPGLYWKLPD